MVNNSLSIQRVFSLPTILEQNTIYLVANNINDIIDSVFVGGDINVPRRLLNTSDIISIIEERSIMVYKGVYSSSVIYKIGNVVSYEGATYIATSISIDTLPIDDSSWIVIAATSDGGSGGTGQNGAPGKSAYQLAVQNGFSGTEMQWLLSLKGVKGDDGVNGKSAYQVALDAGFSGTSNQWLSSLNGTNGKSAYQLALDSGFVGTMSQWITSLHGVNGINGTNGTAGANGTNGKSAYQLALDSGFVGTMSQWITSLHGLSGTDGKSAYESALDFGFVGTEEQWLSSLVGISGADGKSAYELAVDSGFSGNQSEWLLSLKGPKGDNGTTGTGSGTDGKSAYEIAVEGGFVGNVDDWLISLEGDTGVDGVDGKSAYELAVDSGFSGNLDDWLLSLKGPKGDNGSGTGDGTPFTVIDWNPYIEGTGNQLTFTPIDANTEYDGNNIIVPNGNTPNSNVGVRYIGLTTNLPSNYLGKFDIAFDNTPNTETMSVNFILYPDDIDIASIIDGWTNNNSSPGVGIASVKSYTSETGEGSFIIDVNNNLVTGRRFSATSGEVISTTKIYSSDSAPSNHTNLLVLVLCGEANNPGIPSVSLIQTAMINNTVPTTIDGNVIHVTGTGGSLCDTTVSVNSYCQMFNNSNEFILLYSESTPGGSSSSSEISSNNVIWIGNTTIIPTMSLPVHNLTINIPTNHTSADSIVINVDDTVLNGTLTIANPSVFQQTITIQSNAMSQIVGGVLSSGKWTKVIDVSLAGGPDTYKTIQIFGSKGFIEVSPVGLATSVGSGNTFQVIEWAPITLGSPSAVEFIADINSTITPNFDGTVLTIDSTSMNPSTINFTGTGSLTKYASAIGNVSNLTSGTFSISGIATNFSYVMVFFTDIPLTEEMILNGLSGGTNVNVFGAITLINHTAVGSNITYLSLIYADGVGNHSNVISDSTQTTLTFSNGVISCESGNLNVDMDSGHIMTVLCTDDLFKMLTNVTPNPIVPINITSTLEVVNSANSEIPSDATDGTVLKIVGHDGLLLGAQVLINDECTLFDNKQDFLLHRPFASDIAVALSDTGAIGSVLPEIQILSGTHDAIYMTKPVSILNHTVLAIGYTTPILINGDVRDGSITIVNRTSVLRPQIFACSSTFKFIPYGTTEDSSYANNGYVGFEQRINTDVPSFTTAVYRLDFNGDRGVIRCESLTFSESVKDLSVTTDYLTILSDVDADGTVSQAEHVDDIVNIRVSTVGKRAGYRLRFGYGVILPISFTIDGFSYGNYNQYTLTQYDITTGYIDVALQYDGITSTSIISIFGSYVVYNPYTNSSIFGQSAIVTFNYEVITPIVPISDFSLSTYNGSISFTVVDTDVLLGDGYVIADSNPTLNGGLSISWGGSIGGINRDPIAGDIVKVDALVSPANSQSDAIVWGEYVQPTIEGVVGGIYTLTQSDIDSYSVVLLFSGSDLYDKQFVKFMVTFYDSTQDLGSASPTNELLTYLSASESPMSGDVYTFPITNIDSLYETGVYNYATATNRSYQELISGETTSELRFGGYPVVLGSKLVVTSEVSDVPNTGFGESSITPPVIEDIDSYIITQDDLDNGQTLGTSFPVTFTAPESNPYFVRVSVYSIDGTTGDRLSANSWSYFIIYPLIDAPTFDVSSVTSISSAGFQTETILLPPQAILNDTLSINDDTSINYTPAIDGIPLNVVVDSTILGDGNYPLYPYFPYNDGVDYVKLIYTRVLRDNVTGVPIRGKLATQTITTTFG